MLNRERIFQDLAPYARMTVRPGITVGDLVFASSQDIWSTGLVVGGGNNIIAANSTINLFSGAEGDVGVQGFTTNELSFSETNMQDREGKFGSNECFIGCRVGFTVGVRSVNTNAAAQTITQPASSDFLMAIADHFTWTWNPGDTIERIMGVLSSYPAGGGPYAGPSMAAAAAAAAVPAAGTGFALTQDAIKDWGCNNGYPDCNNLTKLPVPLIWKPNIRSQITVQNGAQITVAALPTVSNAGPAADQNVITNATFIEIKCVVSGYRMTMPV